MCVFSMLLLVQISVFVNVLASVLTPALKRCFYTSYIVEAGGLFPAGESSSVLVARVVDILPAGGTHSDYHPDIQRAGAHQHLRYQNIQRSDAISQYRIF